MNTLRRNLVVALTFGTCPALRAAPAVGVAPPGATWPSRPIRIVLGLASGGGADSLARQLAERLQRTLGVSVFVESRPGALGTIAATAVARARPDGYTLLLGSPTSITLAPLAQADLAYDPARDFEPISELVRVPLFLIARQGLGVRTVAELLARARLQPGKLNFGSLGPSTSGGLATEIFLRMTGIDVLDVPFSGSAHAMQGLLAGNMDVMFDTGNSALPQARAGKAVLLGISTATRSPLTPDVPPIADVVPGYNVDTWNGLFAPTGTPAVIIERIAGECIDALHDPQFADRLGTMGVEVVASTPATFRASLRVEAAALRRLHREFALKLN